MLCNYDWYLAHSVNELFDDSSLMDLSPEEMNQANQEWNEEYPSGYWQSH